MKAGRQILGVLLLLCGFALAQSPDPLDRWENLAAPGHSIRGLAYKDGTFVAVGYSTNTVVSTNGINWFRGSNGLTGGGLYAVAAGAGQFVAVGPNNVILSSSNGLQWTRRDVNTNGFDDYWAVTYGGGQFVAVGWQGDGRGTLAGTLALTSVDGARWERHLLSHVIDATPRNVAYGNGVYVAAEPTIPASMYSTNGRDWVLIPSVRGTSVAFGNGRFVLGPGLGSAGYISSNGVDWTQISLPAMDPYFTAAYANGVFLFGNGENPRTGVAISTNGIEMENEHLRLLGSDPRHRVRQWLFLSRRSIQRNLEIRSHGADRAAGHFKSRAHGRPNHAVRGRSRGLPLLTGTHRWLDRFRMEPRR